MPGPRSSARTSIAGRRLERPDERARRRRACLTRLVPSLGDHEGELPCSARRRSPSRRARSRRRRAAPRRPGSARSRERGTTSARRSFPSRDRHARALARRARRSRTRSTSRRAPPSPSRGRRRSCSRPSAPARCRRCPGPWSSNISRSPRRAPVAAAPRPRRTRRRRGSSVLRASSLAAVTILVWSTRLKPRSTAHSRTTWRTRDDVLLGADRPASHRCRTAIALLARDPSRAADAGPCPSRRSSAVRTPGATGRARPA